MLTNNTAVAAFSHTIVGALMVAGALLVGIGLWHLRRRRLAGAADDRGRPRGLAAFGAARRVGVARGLPPRRIHRRLRRPS